MVDAADRSRAFIARCLVTFLTLLFIVGCEGGPDLGLSQPKQPAFPPDRAAWDSAPLPARAAHARALHTLLEGTKPGVASWSSADASGTIELLELGPMDGEVCGGFVDTIQIGGNSTSIRDMACWADGWEYLRRPLQPILAPAFAETARVYTVRRGGSLADVARVTGTNVAALERLNPAYPERLPAGTQVLLP